MLLFKNVHGAVRRRSRATRIIYYLFNIFVSHKLLDTKLSLPATLSVQTQLQIQNTIVKTSHNVKNIFKRPKMGDLGQYKKKSKKYKKWQ